MVFFCDTREKNVTSFIGNFYQTIWGELRIEVRQIDWTCEYVNMCTHLSAIFFSQMSSHVSDTFSKEIDCAKYNFCSIRYSLMNRFEFGEHSRWP